MDSVRFGRALGFGARSAARALAGAVDAATAPNPASRNQKPKPSTAAPPPERPQPSAPTPGPIATAARTAARATIQARETRKNFSRGGKRFGEAVWGPLVKLSGVLWLEITGSFFGIFAAFAAQAAWMHRADFSLGAPNHAAHRNALVFLAMTVVFGYFCLSSFVRAHRRQRSR